MWSVVVGLAVLLPAADPAPVEPFNGKDLSGWKLKGDKAKSFWSPGICVVVPDQPGRLALTKYQKDPATDRPASGQPVELVNREGGGVDVYTERAFGDCRVELEFMVPKGSNSGVYLLGEYEVQVFDSFGKEKLGMGDVGAIYGVAVPRVNAAKKPGKWQTFEIDFRAPRFEAGRKTANARFVRVVLNGQVLHENVEVPGPTLGGLTGKEAPAGPLMLQGDHGPVAYRTIRVTPAGD